MRHQRNIVGSDLWSGILSSFGPCRVKGPSDHSFAKAARDQACCLVEAGPVDIYVAVDDVPTEALQAPKVVFVSTEPETEGMGDAVLLPGPFRRAVDDVLLLDRYRNGAVRTVRTYERDVPSRCCGESRRAGRLAEESIRRHMAAAWQTKIGDIVLDIAGGHGFRSYLIAGLSPVASVLSLLPENRLPEALMRFGAWSPKRLRFDDASRIAAHLSRARYDCIVCRHRQIDGDLLDAVASGGRLVVLGRTTGPLPGFRRDADPWAGMEIWMRCPLAAADLPVEDRFFLSAQAGTPRSLDPAWMHENPGVAAALVTVPSRLRSHAALASLAEDVVGASPPGSKDALSALVVLGHRLLDGQSGMTEGEWLRRAGEGRARAGTDAPFIRWRVSLDFVEARIHEAAGRMQQACASYRRVSEVDATLFHPSLLTKTAEAAIRAARIEMAFGDAEGARSLLRRAVSTTRATLGSDPSQIIGEEGAFTDFYMLEAAATLQMAAYAALALNLDRRSGEEALRRFLATPPKPRMIFGGPVPPPPAGSPSRPDAVRRIAARLKRGLESLYLMRPPEVVSGFVMLPFD